MRQPDSTTPGSVMPRYPHLLTDRYDTSLIASKMRALRTVGVPYTDGEIETAVSAMEQQARVITAEVESQQGPPGLGDKEITALTAYLQRLGTDIRWKRPAVEPLPLPAIQAGIAPPAAGASAPATPAATATPTDHAPGQAPVASKAAVVPAAVK